MKNQNNAGQSGINGSWESMKSLLDNVKVTEKPELQGGYFIPPMRCVASPAGPARDVFATGLMTLMVNAPVPNPRMKEEIFPLLAMGFALLAGLRAKGETMGGSLAWPASVLELVASGNLLAPRLPNNFAVRADVTAEEMREQWKTVKAALENMEVYSMEPQPAFTGKAWAPKAPGKDSFPAWVAREQLAETPEHTEWLEKSVNPMRLLKFYFGVTEKGEPKVEHYWMLPKLEVGKVTIHEELVINPKSGKCLSPINKQTNKPRTRADIVTPGLPQLVGRPPALNSLRGCVSHLLSLCSKEWLDAAFQLQYVDKDDAGKNETIPGSEVFDLVRFWVEFMRDRPRSAADGKAHLRGEGSRGSKPVWGQYSKEVAVTELRRIVAKWGEGASRTAYDLVAGREGYIDMLTASSLAHDVMRFGGEVEDTRGKVAVGRMWVRGFLAQFAPEQMVKDLSPATPLVTQLNMLMYAMHTSQVACMSTIIWADALPWLELLTGSYPSEYVLQPKRLRASEIVTADDLSLVAERQVTVSDLDAPMSMRIGASTPEAREFSKVTSHMPEVTDQAVLAAARAGVVFEEDEDEVQMQVVSDEDAPAPHDEMEAAVEAEPVSAPAVSGDDAAAEPQGEEAGEAETQAEEPVEETQSEAGEEEEVPAARKKVTPKARRRKVAAGE